MGVILTFLKGRSAILPDPGLTILRFVKSFFILDREGECIARDLGKIERYMSGTEPRRGWSL